MGETEETMMKSAVGENSGGGSDSTQTMQSELKQLQVIVKQYEDELARTMDELSRHEDHLMYLKADEQGKLRQQLDEIEAKMASSISKQ